MATMKTISTDQLRRELDRREASAGKLQTRRDELLAQIRDLETEIEAITGDKIANGTARGRATPAPATRSTGRRGPRPKNDVSLAEALVQAAEIGAQLTPKEAAGYVLANGYKTTGKQFGVQVATALAKDGRFKRVSRGLYEREK